MTGQAEAKPCVRFVSPKKSISSISDGELQVHECLDPDLFIYFYFYRTIFMPVIIEGNGIQKRSPPMIASLRHLMLQEQQH